MSDTDPAKSRLELYFYTVLYEAADSMTRQLIRGLVPAKRLAVFLEDFSLKIWRAKIKKWKPQIIIFSGPTGVGKTTILHGLEERFDIRRFLNVFTREVRPDDRSGDFIPMSTEEFGLTRG